MLLRSLSSLVLALGCTCVVRAQGICLEYPGFTYSGGNDLWGITAADLNNDGLLDLAVSNHGTNDISILFGNGDATFQPHVTLPTGVNPVDIQAVDLDLDGLIDLVTAGQNFSGVQVFMNQGSGTFAPFVNYPASGGAYTLEVLDVNGDLFPDALVPYDNAIGGLAVLLGNGDGTFATAVMYLTDVPPVSLDLADLNNDGNVDVVYTHLPGLSETQHFFSILWGTGLGVFGAPTHVFCPHTSLQALTADLDGDGNVDVLTSNRSHGSISKHAGHGDGTFDPEVNYPAYIGPMGIQLHDMDMDGAQDLLIAESSANGLDVMPGDGLGNFGTLQHLGCAVNPIEFVVGSFNADAYPDVMIASSTGATIGHVINCTITMIDDHQQLFRITLSANPADGELTITIPLNFGTQELEVLDARGRSLFAQRVSGPQLVLDTRSLSNGLYVLRISRNGRTVARERFVVHHP